MIDTGVPVYVVDDDASVREAVGSLISSAGLRAETFPSAQEFLASTRAEAPSCLVLDVELPGLNGLDLQEELAKANVRIPIIFLTGRANISMSVRAMKAGALDFLTKPVDDEVLLDAIRKGIAHYRTPQQRRGTLPSLAIDDVRLEERVKERTRIARELHDTLLQSFQGLTFRFQAANNLLPERPGEAKQTLEGAIAAAAKAITEARDAVHELRSSTTVTNDLAAAVAALGDELAELHTTDTDNQDSPAFVVEVQGQPRDLHPILRDEIYRIAREAVRNAFRHAKARRIEAEIHYSDKVLRLRIRDDGRGMDPGIVEEGLIGHYGLLGMCERATQIGGQLDVWSRTGAGTEIELRIPGSICIRNSAGPHSLVAQASAGAAQLKSVAPEKNAAADIQGRVLALHLSRYDRGRGLTAHPLAGLSGGRFTTLSSSNRKYEFTHLDPECASQRGP